jgi:shikimate dehydrogenase
MMLRRRYRYSEERALVAQSSKQQLRKAEFSYLRWSDTPDFAPYDLIVNTTPAGAADVLANSVTGTLLQSSSAQFHNRAILFDVIYKPWPTVLASRWRDSGGTVINGSEMLLYQGNRPSRIGIGSEPRL